MQSFAVGFIILQRSKRPISSHSSCSLAGFFDIKAGFDGDWSPPNTVKGVKREDAAASRKESGLESIRAIDRTNEDLLLIKET